MSVADISDRDWVQAQLDEGVTVTALAKAAGVSRQTVYTWLGRHGLETKRSTPDRPDPDVLAALYAQHGTVAGVGDVLGVSADTARRWLHAAGVTVGDPPLEVDVDEVRRRRRAGATLEQIASEQGVGPTTIWRRLNEKRKPPR